MSPVQFQDRNIQIVLLDGQLLGNHLSARFRGQHACTAEPGVSRMVRSFQISVRQCISVKQCAAKNGLVHSFMVVLICVLSYIHKQVYKSYFCRIIYKASNTFLLNHIEASKCALIISIMTFFSQFQNKLNEKHRWKHRNSYLRLQSISEQKRVHIQCATPKGTFVSLETSKCICTYSTGS